jgi:hypothetical protein
MLTVPWHVEEIALGYNGPHSEYIDSEFASYWAMIVLLPKARLFSEFLRVVCSWRESRS